MMHDDEWCNVLKRYQAAVSVFNEAVDRLTMPVTSFQHAWESAEKARIEVARTHAAILNHEQRHFAAAFGGKHEVITFYQTEELVLGDQGQSGG
jgi:hypothetical protein